MKKVILWLLIVFFSVLIISSMVGGSYEGFQEGAETKAPSPSPTPTSNKLAGKSIKSGPTTRS